MTTTQVMRPGILVALKTSVQGGVRYTRQDLENDGTIARWETTREITNPEEHQRAAQVRRLAQRAINRLCIRTTFGLLCPLDREEELDVAIAAVRTAVDEWNSQAQHTWVTANVIKGRIADNDQEALRALLGEATDLVERMDKGLARADVKEIRDAASKAKSLVEIMDEESGARVSAAVTAARSAAREIVKRVVSQGESAVTAVQAINRESFDKARFAFLDMAEGELEALPPVDVQRMAAIEAFMAANLTPEADDGET